MNSGGVLRTRETVMPTHDEMAANPAHHAHADPRQRNTTGPRLTTPAEAAVPPEEKAEGDIHP